MRKSHGFTIVEIVIVMVIMAILLGLATFSIQGAQANARDTERKTDIENLARGLENRYKNGNGNTAVTSTAGAFIGPGAYPGTNEWNHMVGFDKTGDGWVKGKIDGGYGPLNLPGTTINDFKSPGATSDYNGIAITCAWACGPPEDSSFIQGLFNDAQKQKLYYYEPIDANGNLCTDGPCVRFNLYWRPEIVNNAANTSNKYETVRSRHQ